MAAGAPLAWPAMADAIGSSFNQGEGSPPDGDDVAVREDGSPGRESAMDRRHRIRAHAKMTSQGPARNPVLIEAGILLTNSDEGQARAAPGSWTSTLAPSRLLGPVCPVQQADVLETRWWPSSS
jgi:hypothetical protein